MSSQDDFELWLGRIRDQGSRDRFTSRVIRSANLAGGIRRALPRRTFHGNRIGRGAGVGRVLVSGRRSHASARRVIVKASIVRLGPKGLARATAHMRYLERDGTTREGERGSLYSAELDRADGKAFVERGEGDRHQFRFIVSPEDGSEYGDLKPLVRRLMTQVEQDLGTKLDWLAVDHFNTGHPHSHILVRGKDGKGKDLILAREYMTQGLRARATELVNLDLGPRTELEIARSQQREVEQERFTSIDRRLVAARDTDGLAAPRHRNPIEQDLRTARLRRLAHMGLAEEMAAGRWRLDPELEPILKRMGERGDVIKTLNRTLAIAMSPRLPQEQAIHDLAQGERLIGRLVAQGLSDEHADRRYLILDATDGRTLYVDIGQANVDATHGSVVSVAPRVAEVREVDRTVADIAAAAGGRYSTDIHLAHERSATPAFVRSHIRRLEAIRRAGGGVSRNDDGSWTIAPDHLAKVEAYERRLVQNAPVQVERLSAAPIEQLPVHDGATWLDRELTTAEPVRLGRGFGAEVRKALERRRQWLLAERLATLDGDRIRFRSNMIDELEQRDLRRVAAALSRELGKPFAEAVTGERIEGTLRRPVEIGDRKFALVEKAKQFTLVPWRAVLEEQLGRQVSGIVREGGISWTFGRERGPSIGM